MGDKSPKAKERQQKQNITQKKDEKTAALAKAKAGAFLGQKAVK